MKKIFFGLLAAALVTGALAWLHYERNRSAVSSCINNLRQIDGAKQEWAMEKKAPSNAVPTWDDLIPALMRDMPKCPAGGTYIMGRLDERPRCSIGGPEHSLQ